MKKLLVFLVMFFLLLGSVSAQDILGKHGQMGFACAMCHGDANPPTKRAPISACMQCHESYERVAALTADVVPNPHQSHQGEVRCTLCHKSHEPSVLYCNECHQFDLKFH